MDEKSRAKAELDRPAYTGGKSGGPSVKLALGVGLALMVALVCLIFVGVALLRHRPAATPRPMPAPVAQPPVQPAAAPPQQSVAQTVESQSALDAYRPYMKFSEVTADFEDDLLEGEVPVVRGKLENAGTRTLAYVEVTAYFLNADGKRIHEQRFAMIGGLVNNLVGGDAAMRPGYIQPFEFKASTTPSEWARGKVEVEVTGIRFGPDTTK